MDGFFRYSGVNYYLVGEWFLGAIIMLYALYPLLLKAVNKFGWLMAFVSLALCVWKVSTDTFGSVLLNRMAYYGGCFLLGMVIFKYQVYHNKIVLPLSALVSLLLLFVKIDLTTAYADYLLGISMFFCLYALGSLLMKAESFNRVVNFFSGLTFPMFLVQNQVSGYLVSTYLPVSFQSVMKVIVCSVLLCTISGWCVKVMVSALTHTKWYMSIEKFLIHR